MNKVSSNDEFVGRNLQMLVKKFPGQRVVISCGRVFTGTNAVAMARKLFPKVIPLSMPIPRPDEFLHIL